MKDTKEIILKTAYNMFLYNNYEAVTLNNIIKATGLSKGAIYHYYASKEEIFKAVVDEYMLRNRAESTVEYSTLKELIQDSINKINNKITDLASENCNFHSEIPINYLSLMVSAHRYYPNYGEIGCTFFKSQLAKWNITIKKAIESNEIHKDIDIEACTANFVYINFGIVSNMIIGGSLKYALDMLERQYWELYKQLSN